MTVCRNLSTPAHFALLSQRVKGRLQGSLFHNGMGALSVSPGEENA